MVRLIVVILVAMLSSCKSTKLATYKEDKVTDRVEIEDIITSFGKDLSIDKDIVLDFIYIAPDSSIIKGTVKDNSKIAYKDTTKRKEAVKVVEKDESHKEVIKQEARNTKTKVEQWTSLVWAIVILLAIIILIRFYRKYLK